jgi:pyruvate formate lyase activating enzyme
MNSGAEVDLALLQERVLANQGFVDGLGVTGGEPCLQPDAVTSLFKWARKAGFKTFLNTNGTNPDLVSSLGEERALSFVALDIKAPLEPQAYNRVTGLANSSNAIAQIRRTLRTCIEHEISFEARTTIVPDLIEDEESIRRITRLLEGNGAYFLQEFVPFEDIPDQELRRKKPPIREHLLKLARSSLDEGATQVYIRTREHGSERVTL